MYYQKYLKYKKKYINLKNKSNNQTGGSLCATNDDVFKSDTSKKFKALVSHARNFLIPPNSRMFSSTKYFDAGTTELNWGKISIFILEQLLQELEIYKNKDASYDAKKSMVDGLIKDFNDVKSCLNKQYSDIKLLSIVNNVTNINGIKLGVPKDKFTMVTQIPLEYYEKLIRWSCDIDCKDKKEDSPFIKQLNENKNNFLKNILSPVNLTSTATLTSTDFTVSFSPSIRSPNYIPDYSTKIPGLDVREVSDSDIDDLVDQLNEKSNKKQPVKHEKILNIFRKYPKDFSESYLRTLPKKIDEYKKNKTIIFKNDVVLTWTKDSKKKSIKIIDLVSKEQFGKQMMKILKKFLQKNKKNQINLNVLSDNEKTIDFYKKMGFKIVGITKIDDMDALKMRWSK